MAKKQFKAESKRLLDLMINSIYTHREIFLRELISNASDAIDKLAYQALTDESVGLSRSDFAITLTADKDAGTLTVSDNGIGMTREEMEQNLGTIAHSGSLGFKQEMEKKEDIDIIGQFGVGFYAAFMVADKVTVISKRFGSDEAWKWESEGADGYSVEPCERAGAGTDVILTLKKDTEEEKYSEYLSEYRLRSLVRKYSDYIRYPIRMEVETSRPTEETKDSDKPEYETVREMQTLNSMVPVWQKNKKDVTEEEYDSFYREKFYDFEKPLSVIHLSVEGAVTYKALLYIPAKAPYDFYTKDYKAGLQLYSSGVLIMENCADLLPEHFRFVRGVVDTQDLSLNISREMLQHTRELKFIAGNLEKKIKAELEKMLENDREKYEKFFNVFGTQLKYGIIGDYGMKRDLLTDLLLYRSAEKEKLVSLREYVDAMPENQKYIYYAAAETPERAAKLPQTEQVRAKGFDILCFSTDADEFVAEILGSYAEKKFCNVCSQDLGLESDEEKAAADKTDEEYKPLTDFVKETLGDAVANVKISRKLKNYAVCLSVEGGITLEMERYFHAMPGADPNAMRAQRVLELNLDHPAVKALDAARQENPERAAVMAKVLFAQAQLVAGITPDDPAEYGELVCKLF